MACYFAGDLEINVVNNKVRKSGQLCVDGNIRHSLKIVLIVKRFRFIFRCLVFKHFSFIKSFVFNYYTSSLNKNT